jgi:hypothetical protein
MVGQSRALQKPATAAPGADPFAPVGGGVRCSSPSSSQPSLVTNPFAPVGGGVRCSFLANICVAREAYV